MKYLTQLTTIIAIRPPTSPTTFIGGFSLAGCAGTPTDTSIVRDLKEIRSCRIIWKEYPGYIPTAINKRILRYPK